MWLIEKHPLCDKYFWPINSSVVRFIAEGSEISVNKNDTVYFIRFCFDKNHDIKWYFNSENERDEVLQKLRENLLNEIRNDNIKL